MVERTVEKTARTIRISTLLVVFLLVLPLVASAVVEPKTKTEYPDEITIEKPEGSATLKVTGVGLREKTFMKVDVYTIVSYIHDTAVLEGDPGDAVRDLREPKRIQMDMRRGFSCDKLTNAFTEIIDKNYDNQVAFAADLDTFVAYFSNDAEEGDKLVFEYCPKIGLTTILNGEELGVIENFEFVRALWTVWFGKKPANDGLKKNLLAELDS